MTNIPKPVYTVINWQLYIFWKGQKIYNAARFLWAVPQSRNHTWCFLSNNENSMVDFAQMKLSTYDLTSPQPSFMLPEMLKGGTGKGFWPPPAFWSLPCLNHEKPDCGLLFSIQQLSRSYVLAADPCLGQKTKRTVNNVLKGLCLMQSWSFQLKLFIKSHSKVSPR